MNEAAFTFVGALLLAIVTFVVTVVVAAADAGTYALGGLAVAGALALAGVLMAHAQMIRERGGSDPAMSTYTDDELARIEETLGPKARRNAVARFDIRQRHLTEFMTNCDPPKR